jgi:hypothetical protein
MSNIIVIDREYPLSTSVVTYEENGRILGITQVYVRYNLSIYANQGLKEECEGAKRGSGSVKFAREIQINSSKVALSDL